ncbi:MAG: Gfo/Idh/MocA family protein, partial [Bacillota bacterium]
MDRVRFCLIGAGRAGMVDARNYEFKVEQSEVVAVVDPNPENAENAAEELGAESYSSLEEALTNHEFEAVCIGAPTFAHSRAIIGA